MQPLTQDLVLVTGATGYVASFLIKILLEQDYKVRGTVRSLANKSSYDFLYNLVPEKNSNLELVEADLSNKASWGPATKGTPYVFHVASPIPQEGSPKTEEFYIKPAIEGTMNVLEAALENGVKKVVLTSTGGTIALRKGTRPWREEDWQEENDSISLYGIGKIRAEKAAWDFYEKNRKIEMTTLHPSFIFGPLVNNRSNSSSFVGHIMNGIWPGVFETVISVVDVRDTADMHLKAMFDEKSNGQRYICASESVSLAQVASWLNKEFGDRGIHVPEKEVSLEDFMKSENPLVQTLGFYFRHGLVFDHTKSEKELGMNYIPVEKTIIDTGNDLLKYGIVKEK